MPHPRPLLSALWRVLGFQLDQEVRPGVPYDWDNRDRDTSGSVVVQLSIDAGLIYEAAGQDSIEVPAGATLLYTHREASRYRLRSDHRGYRCHHAVLRGAGLVEHWRDLREAHGSVLGGALDGPIAHALLRTVAQAAHADPLQEAAAVHDLVTTLFATARGQRRAAIAPVEGAVEAILSSPYHPWSFKTLASEYGCSREHLLRTFRERVGEPPAAWLKRQRLERVLHLLRESDLSIAEIASQCGFGSAHTLTRTVRETVGCAPTQWRVAQQGGR